MSYELLIEKPEKAVLIESRSKLEHVHAHSHTHKEREREREKLTEPVTIVEVLVLSPNSVVDIGCPTHVRSHDPPSSRDPRNHRHLGAH
jgi:hypothetical protein